MRWFMLVAVLALVGCGKDDGSDTAAQETHSLYVANASVLPACDEASEGRLAYVATEKVFQACLGGTWTVVEHQNEPVEIKHQIVCAGVINDFAYVAKYKATTFSNGDIFVNGAIGDSFAEFGRSEYFPAKHATAEYAPIIITLDSSGEPTSGFWTLTANRETLVLGAAYIDAEIGDQAQVFSFPAENCEKTDY